MINRSTERLDRAYETLVVAKLLRLLLDGPPLPQEPPAGLQQEMEARVARVAVRTGYTKPIRVTFDPSAGSGLEASIVNNAVVYGPEVSKHTDCLDGGIAHEIGHLEDGFKLHDIRDKERFADAYAVEHGYGEQLIAYLESATSGGHDYCDENCPHGKMPDRIARIRQQSTAIGALNA